MRDLGTQLCSPHSAVYISDRTDGTERGLKNYRYRSLKEGGKRKIDENLQFQYPTTASAVASEKRKSSKARGDSFRNDALSPLPPRHPTAEVQSIARIPRPLGHINLRAHKLSLFRSIVVAEHHNAFARAF